MSFYIVRHSAHRDFEATVGWDREYHTYWFVTFYKNRPGTVNDRLSNHGGDEDGDEIPTLYDLLDTTWGFIRWDLEEETLAQLLADPAREEEEWHHSQLLRVAKREQIDHPTAIGKARDITALLERVIPPTPPASEVSS